MTKQSVTRSLQDDVIVRTRPTLSPRATSSLVCYGSEVWACVDRWAYGYVGSWVVWEPVVVYVYCVSVAVCLAGKVYILMYAFVYLV